MGYYNFEICDYFMSTLPTIKSRGDAKQLAKKLPVYEHFENKCDIKGVEFWDGDTLYRVVRVERDEFFVAKSVNGYYGSEDFTVAEIIDWFYENKDAINAAIKVSAEDGYLDGEEL